jgi:hypothetical protein
MTGVNEARNRRERLLETLADEQSDDAERTAS